MALRQAISRYTCVLFFLVALCSWALTAGDKSASFLGEFSNVRYTEEHAYGYSVLLWKEGDKLFGLFYDFEGLAGDTPVGLLEDIQLDSGGKLSFRAKLSVAAIYLGQGKQQPTHDVFTFKGSLSQNGISGDLTHEEQHQSKPRPLTTHIQLPELAKSEQEELFQASSYADWRALVDPVLKTRGPKW